MSDHRPSLDTGGLVAAGFDLVAAIDLAALPPEVSAPAVEAAAVRGVPKARQLILVGQAGPRLWSIVRASGIDTPDPIDDYTAAAVRAWATAAMPGRRVALIYPGNAPVGLQAIGRHAGWHHDSPFMVGINARCGPWFAYRALLATDSDWAPTPPMAGGPPCARCIDRPCVTACPADAVAGDFDLAACIAWRRRPGSPCAASCLARCACPVGAAHRYPPDLMQHSYGRSLADLARHLRGHGTASILAE